MAPLALAILVLALGWVAYRWVFGITLLGYDTYPLIATSRPTSMGGLLALLSSELMAGRYTVGAYWRPFTTLSFALDHALFGLGASGYHATDFGILIACALALAFLLHRMLGSGSLLGPSFAALLFLLHPVQLEVLPVPPRRADTLCLLFTALALATQMRARERPASAWQAALLAFCAAASKELGILCAPLVLVLELARARGRWREALARSLPTGIAIAVFLVLRTLILGGIGGREKLPVDEPLFARVVHLFPQYLERVLHPQPFLSGGVRVFVVLASILSVAALLLLARAEPRAPARALGTRGGALVLGAWWLGALLLSATTGLVEAWYVMLFVALESLLLGMLLSCALLAVRRGARIVPAGSLVVVLALTAVQLARSPLFHPYDDWERASKLALHYRGEIERALERAQPGGPPIQVQGFVPRFPPPEPGRVGVKSVVLHTDYSLAAWIELAHPEIEARVTRGNGFVEISRLR